MRDALRLSVLGDMECRPRQAADEPALLIGHSDRHLDDVHVDLLGKAEGLRAHGPDDAAALQQVRHGAHLMFLDRAAGVPVALKGLRVDRAHVAAIHEEHERRRRAVGLDAGAQPRATAQVGVGIGRLDAQLRLGLRRLRPRVTRRRADRNREARGKRDRVLHGCDKCEDVSGTSGPSAVMAAT